MKGYINIDLGGQKRGIKFGNRALLDIMAKHQVAGNGNGIKFSFDLVVDLIYYGLINNCMLKRENVEFTPEDVEAWVDDMEMPALLEVFHTFEASYLGEPSKTPEAPAKMTKLQIAEAKKKSA